jgi:hypothetical protein
MNQLPPDFNESVGMACFEPLWRPEGRGAMEDLNLIQWIDDNAHFVVDHWTIREWSQIKPAYLITQSDDIDKVTPSSQRIPFQPVDTIGESFDWVEIKQGRVSLTAAYSEDFYTSSNFNTFIGAIHRVLESGMRLANIDNGRCPAAMVHPDAQINDEVFYIRGCSIPVVLRKKNDRYMVIGGAYLHEDLKGLYLAAEAPGRPSFLKEINLC